MNHNLISTATRHLTFNTFTKSVLALALCSASAAYANDYNSVTFFGDSLTDGGYFSPITQGALGLPQSGQFTTNPDNVWATSFAQQLGTSAVANTFGAAQTGNNYAIGGARAGVDVIRNFGTTENPINIPIASVNSQANSYLATNRVDPNGLYVVWAGANDLLAVTEDPANAQATIGSAIGSQIATITALKNSGANYILVPNVPDVGLTPSAIAQGPGAQALSTAITQQYNQAMLSSVAATGANIIPLDTFSLLQQIAANPTRYGFTNMTQPACNSPSSLTCGRDNLVAPNANNTYFFADGIHPTGRAHQLVANYAHAVVTAPSQIGVLPHIATISGLRTNDQVQTHVNRLQYDKPLPARQLWVQGNVESQDIAGLDSSGNAQVLLGADFAHNNTGNAVTGLYGNLSQKEFDNNSSGVSNIDLDEIGLGVYHSTTLNNLGGLRLNGAIGFGALDLDVTRTVKLGDYNERFKSAADGKRYHASVQADYPMLVSNITVTPYLGATVSRVTLDALKEQELSGLAMQFDEQKYTTTYGKLGVKAQHNLANNINVFGDIHYQKQLDDNREAVSARLNTIQDISFTTPMTDLDDDNIGMTLGVSRSFGALNANAGISHSRGDDDKTTSVFVGLSGTF